jgi:hypothetical protein
VTSPLRERRGFRDVYECFNLAIKFLKSYKKLNIFKNL